MTMALLVYKKCNNTFFNQNVSSTCNCNDKSGDIFEEIAIDYNLRNKVEVLSAQNTNVGHALSHTLSLSHKQTRTHTRTHTRILH
jgi:hypothetical protein